jgi:heptosyltransferase II
MSLKDCRYFSGYKPCRFKLTCESGCARYSPATHRVLVVALGAMGAVLRATSALPGIVRKLPGCHITWLTEPSSRALLENNPLIDRTVVLNFDGLLELGGRQFDHVFVMDKDLRIGGILNSIQAKHLHGFQVNYELGVIEPAEPFANELYQIGLDDKKKFFDNQKPETQLLFEAFGLGQWVQDPYVLSLTESEREVALFREQQWSRDGKRPVVGLNTGCSPTIRYKKLSVEGHRQLILQIQKHLPGVAIVLLGGPDDDLRNQQIAGGLDVIQSPTRKGLRDGLASVAACDVIFSGDSLGMHMAIALEKWTVAWFGPTCAQEIDLYGRGEKIIAQTPCHPCWKRSCDRTPMCYDRVSYQQVVEALQRGLMCKSLSSKRRSWEISFSASPS